MAHYKGAKIVETHCNFKNKIKTIIKAKGAHILTVALPSYPMVYLQTIHSIPICNSATVENC